jgi:hypothetical protein
VPNVLNATGLILAILGTMSDTTESEV